MFFPVHEQKCVCCLKEVLINGLLTSPMFIQGEEYDVLLNVKYLKVE